MTDDFYMARCIDLAKKATGNTYPNPLVGAVIVYDDKIIGEGYHHKAGENHAEINAINSVSDKTILPLSTIYVSLEPCAHYGKTPPCAIRLKEIGFKRVVIGAMDVHDKVNGKGKQILLEAGIETESGVLKQECEALNKRFFTFHLKKRSFMILKWAESGDGFLDKDFKPTAIGNSLSKQFVHQLRSKEHSILVGTNTALTDDPGLTTREINGRNPVRVLIDLNLKVPESHQLYNAQAETIVINTIKNEKLANINFIKIKGQDFLPELMEKLFNLEIQSVIIEGGSKMLQSFINENLWDEAVIIKNEKLLLQNGTSAPEFLNEAFKTEYLRDNKISFYRNKQ